jgi:hypothetical protein
MTRNDFELIARTIRDLQKPQYGYLKDSTRERVAEAFADMAAGTNPNFNRARFLEACGVRSA